MKNSFIINNTALWLELPGYLLSRWFLAHSLSKGFFNTNGYEKTIFMRTPPADPLSCHT